VDHSRVPSPATLRALAERGTESFVKWSAAKRSICFNECGKLTRIARWKAETAERRGEIRSASTLRGISSSSNPRSIAGDPITQLEDDTCSKPATDTRRRCEELLIAVYESATERLRSMCSEQRKSYLWSNPAHIKKRGEETLLVTTGESDKALAIFANNVMKIEFNLRPFRE
jgi:hypothetical protein